MRPTRSCHLRLEKRPLAATASLIAVRDLPQEPFDSPWQFDEVLTAGKVLHERVNNRANDYRETIRLLRALSEEELARLAFYEAAENVADSVDKLGKMDPWTRWWLGIDSPGEESPTEIDTTPQRLWKIMRPEDV